VRQQSAGAGKEAMPKAFLSIRRWRGGELDRGAGGGHAACMGLGSWRLDGAARGAHKGGGGRGATQGVVAGCLAPASRLCSGNDTDRPA
jgi:hypothetical protein